MCAAAASAPIPLYKEGKQYWQDLTDECQRYVECVNATLVRNGIDRDALLECTVAADSLQIATARRPSTNVKVVLDFRSWGPVIAATVRNQQSALPEEFELPLALDLDGQMVAIYDEGRSFSPHEVASYLKQSFHCCYPGISLPC
jgi:hypothetical protein